MWSPQGWAFQKSWTSPSVMTGSMSTPIELKVSIGAATGWPESSTETLVYLDPPEKAVVLSADS